MTTNIKYRARFCPSPSGSIHLGNAKTAIFNYLFAQRYNADLLFRIEDTDQARTVAGAADRILDELKWLGISFTMGYGTNNKPAGEYSQSGRLKSYQELAFSLLEKGLAYKCYCSEDELEFLRKEAFERNPKAPFKYPGTCRSIKQDLNKEFIIRFKAPTEGCIEFEDIAFGKRIIPNKENYDFVILRKDGSPLYNWAVVVDDGITDQITHVIRGSDHIKNMPQQLLLLEALGLPKPVYCHLPMLLNNQGAKLSKRDGSVSVSEFRALGYAPSAIVNYLIRVGWGYKNQEIFSMSELIEKFSLDAVGKNDAKFDPKKFEAINHAHLKNPELVSNDQYVKSLVPFLSSKGMKEIPHNSIIDALPMIRPRAKTLAEAADMLEPFLTDRLQLSITKDAIPSNLQPHINSLFEAFVETPETSWKENHLRTTIQKWLDTHQLLLKDVGAFLRLSLLGRSHSPELFQVMQFLGRDRSLRRLEKSVSEFKQLDN